MESIYAMEFQSMEHLDPFPLPRSGQLASGFMTPASSPEARRDSVFSAQSSFSHNNCYASDISTNGDLSTPLTPYSHRSPFVEDVSQMDLIGQYETIGRNEYTCGSLEGISQGTQEVTGGQLNAFDQNWVLPSQKEEHFNGPQFHHGNILPMAAEMDASYRGLQLHGPKNDTEPVEWGNWTSTLVASGYATPYHHERQKALETEAKELMMRATVVGRLKGEETEQDTAIWQQYVPGTIIPADTMMNAEDKSLRPDGDDIERSSSAYGDNVPECLLWTRDSTQTAKEEAWRSVSPDLFQFERKICVTQTGGKGVKKERRRKQSSRRARLTQAKSSIITDLNGIGIELTQEVEPSDIVRNIETGKYSRKDGPKETKRMCEWKFEDGTMCTQMFKRPEHRKRHRDIHKRTEEHWCKVPNCRTLPFNRKDNYHQHYLTHIFTPGKAKRNDRYELHQVLEWAAEPKLQDRILKKYNKQMEKLNKPTEEMNGQWNME